MESVDPAVWAESRAGINQVPGLGPAPILAHIAVPVDQYGPYFYISLPFYIVEITFFVYRIGSPVFFFYHFLVHGTYIGKILFSDPDPEMFIGWILHLLCVE